VLDSLDVAPGFEAALAAALGEDLETALDPDAPAHWGACGDGADDPVLPAGSEPLSHFVSGPDCLRRRLRQVGVVTEADAPALFEQLAPGQRLVTREGGLWRWDGLRARPGSPNAGATRLLQRNRLTALLEDVKAAQHQVADASTLFQAARAARTDAQRLEETTRGALREARKALEARRARLTQAERRASRIGESLSAFAGGLARIEAETDTAQADVQGAANAVAALGETTELRSRRDAIQVRAVELRGRAAELRLDVEKAAHSEELRLRRIAGLAVEREQWLARVGKAGERGAELSGRLGLIASELAGLAENPGAFEHRRRALLGEVSAAERIAAAASDRLAEAESEHRRAGQGARAALEAFSLARETRARDEERVIAAEARRTEVAAQIREQFGRPAHEIHSLAGLDDLAALPAAVTVETRLHRLKAERERLGGVNLRAEEEAQEMETRLDTMRAEHADLESAIARLRHGIHNLNREGRERLLVAFETVNGHFQSLFHSLFGGGAAELTLTGSDDPLEAGLDIVARPPGKRPQTMTLLSGGEQALTAMSLIFAVFLTNPSPICVLDEVDAPLDDANVERFCGLLDDMRSRTDTRFLVVTHNPITMARMDRLYGVTMAEPGVSQIVSVDLESAERFREAS
jgi:chromosome segregation protein